MSNKESQGSASWRRWITPRRVGEALGAAALLTVSPRQLARAVRRAFRSAAERRREEETRREVQVRMGQARIRRLLAKQRALEKRLLTLAKRALSLGDEARFRQLGQQILALRQSNRQWERYLLTLDMLAARRDQAQATAEMVAAVKAVSDSLAASAEGMDMTALQEQLARGMAQAATLEERTAVLLETVDAALASEAPPDEEALQALQADLTADIVNAESSAFDPDLEADLQRMRAELEGKGQ